MDRVASSRTDAAHWAARRTDLVPLSDTERADFEAWLSESPDHSRQLAAIERRWRDPHLAIAAENIARQGATQSRRIVLAGAVTTSFGGAAWLYRAPIQRRFADYASAVGELRVIDVATGARITLDTASAVSQTGGEGWELIQGAMRLDLARDMDFSLQGRAAHVTARGASLTMRLAPDGDRLAVLAGDVRVGEQSIAPGEAVTLVKGMTPRPARMGLVERDSAEGFVEAWRLFQRAPLRLVITELERYRTGAAWVSDAAARILVSGRYRFMDPEGVLSALATTLPIAVGRVGPLVRISAR